MNRDRSCDQEILLRHQPWIIDSLTIGKTVRARGWALADDPHSCRFLINDSGPALAEYPMKSPDLETFFESLPAKKIGSFELMGATPESGNLVKLTFERSGADRDLVENSAWYFPRCDSGIKVPSEEEMSRVILGQSNSSFLLGGASIYGRFDNLLRRRFDRPLPSFERVLDWGCGAGRLTRFLLAQPDFASASRSEVHGIDIDDVNIHWCQSHLPGGHFMHISPTPPTLYANHTFDLVFGISVMTHLREHHQLEWLDELQRITRPGALILLSIQGPTLMVLNSTPDKITKKINRAGFVVTGDNPQINVELDGEPYYVDVFHSRAYIREVWGKYFEVLDIIDAIAANQDLVLLRRH